MISGRLSLIAKAEEMECCTAMMRKIIMDKHNDNANVL